jgi:hypothetical protein
VCDDILFGLDKFTIHLFSHSVQLQADSSSVPIPISSFSNPSAPPKQQTSSSSQTNGLLICAKTDFNTELRTIEECPILNGHTSISYGKSQSASSACSCKEVKVEDLKRMKNVGDKQRSINLSNTTEARRKILAGNPEINMVQEKQLSLIKLGCKVTSGTHNSNDPLLTCGQNNSESVSLQTTQKCSQAVAESMETSQITIMGNISSSADSKPLCSPCHYSGGMVSKAAHKSAPVQCAPLCFITSQEKSTPLVPVKKEVKKVIQCNICGFTFEDSSILAIHHQLVHCVESSSETPSQKMESSDGCKQGYTTDEKQQFPCHLCSKAFKMRGSLMVHLRVAHSSGIAPGVLAVQVSEIAQTALYVCKI